MASPRLQAVALLVLAVAPALLDVRSRVFFSPDETSYAEVAREMLDTHDAVVPRLDGRPWLEKPPLIYWLLAASFAVFGWGFPAAVILNALLTGLTALVVAWHVSRTSGRAAGVFAAIGYLTMLLPLAAARTALTDPVLTLCATGSLAAFLAPGRRNAVLSGVALGLGVLAKGPIAPLVVLPAALAAVIAERRPRPWPRLALLVGVAGGIAAPWHAALAARGLWHEYVAVFLGQQVASRALDVWRIDEPWWGYLPLLWLATFPWGVHLVPATIQRLRRLNRDATAWAELTAVGFPLLALSSARGKLPHYVLPLLPFVAGWLGRAAVEWWGRGCGHAVRRWGAASGLIGGAALAGCALLAPASRLAPFLPRSLVAAAAVGAVVMACAALAASRGAARQALALQAALALGLVAWLDLELVPHLDRQLLERPLAQAVAADAPPGAVLVAHRWWRASLVAYGRPGWTRSDRREDLDAVLAAAVHAGRPTVVVTLAQFEGDVRSAAWRRGAVAVEMLRMSGLADLDGDVLEAVGFVIRPDRDGGRWFYDADIALPGESGFSGVEGNRWTPTFRWAVARSAWLAVPARPHGDGTLRLRVWGPPDGAEQRVTVRVNGCALGRLVLGRFPAVFALAAPERCLAIAIQKVSFEAARVVVPERSEPGSHDPRTLAFALDWLALDPPTAATRLAPSR